MFGLLLRKPSGSAAVSDHAVRFVVVSAGETRRAVVMTESVVLRCRNIEGLLLIAFDQIQTYSTISPFVTRNLPYDRPSETCAQPWSYLLNRQTAQSDPLPILFRVLGIVDPEVAYHSSIVVLRTSYDHERWVPLRFNDSDLVAYNSFVLLLLGKSLVMGQRCH